MSHTAASKPLVAYMVCSSSCPIYTLIRDAVIAAEGRQLDESICFSGDGFTSIAARILRVNMPQGEEEDHSEVWVRVSGRKKILDAFSRVLSRAKGVYYQVIFANNYGRVLRILLPRERCVKCWESNGDRKCCPLLTAPHGAMAKTTVVTPCGIVYEMIVARKSLLESIASSMGCKIVLTHGIDEYDYMLTEKQEQILIEAYLRGYFTFPRKISMKDLAKELGLSVSSLAEHLRKAEAKVIEAFVRHEMPHYLVEAVLARSKKQYYVKSEVEKKTSIEQLASSQPAL